ncbi:hypothetical protein PoB_004178500 [Plakobranchus ocellatus]|uniref:Uncharacterized protein n=1 Tax=Plakobranchus ocellatus TaxID=259542 RepID=A0AAV4B3T3_9GAST|nr:hypothetical protein PoB_004178500 [Plakobranchus ocellatus]
MGQQRRWKKGVKASIYHGYSTDDDPQHQFCHPSPDSWCFYKRSIGEHLYPSGHKNDSTYPCAIRDEGSVQNEVRVYLPLCHPVTKGQCRMSQGLPNPMPSRDEGSVQNEVRVYLPLCHPVTKGRCRMRSGKMFILAGVYDNQRSRSILMYKKLVQTARLLQGQPRLQHPCQVSALVPGWNTRQ